MCRFFIVGLFLLNLRLVAVTRFFSLESGVMSGTALKEIRESRKEGRKGKTKEDADSTWKKWRWDWKYWIGTGLAVVGLVPFFPSPSIGVQPLWTPPTCLRRGWRFLIQRHCSA